LPPSGADAAAVASPARIPAGEGGGGAALDVALLEFEAPLEFDEAPLAWDSLSLSEGSGGFAFAL